VVNYGLCKGSVPALGVEDLGYKLKFKQMTIDFMNMLQILAIINFKILYIHRKHLTIK
jgi:hypothetical protein